MIYDGIAINILSDDFDLMGKPDDVPTISKTDTFPNVLLAAGDGKSMGDSLAITIKAPKGYKVYDVVVNSVSYHIWKVPKERKRK